MEGKNVTGKVKFFDNKLGYGFITMPDGKEAFVHHTAILEKGFRTLQEADSVSFDVEVTPKGLKAKNVQRL